ncbi:hypothetical protein [Streptomyces sp. MZ04]|uniref:hypothetical protein n=1 Tax=Streptomyces sp. MZ04 TaxID=2559236 RepID=UPI001FD72FB1|nr:hypothetical protein [Streptomyces sp. MZ04]
MQAVAHDEGVRRDVSPEGLDVPPDYIEGEVVEHAPVEDVPAGFAGWPEAGVHSGEASTAA